MKKVTIINQTHPLSRSIEVVKCTSFFSKLRGLMFKKNIMPYSGILLSEKSDSVINSAIHMFFMNFDICVVWIDSSSKVVDMQIARRWRGIYKPCLPANQILELHPQRLSDFSIGDTVIYETY